MPLRSSGGGDGVPLGFGVAFAPFAFIKVSSAAFGVGVGAAGPVFGTGWFVAAAVGAAAAALSAGGVGRGVGLGEGLGVAARNAAAPTRARMGLFTVDGFRVRGLGSC